jgi:hypothetical protein
MAHVPVYCTHQTIFMNVKWLLGLALLYVRLYLDRMVLSYYLLCWIIGPVDLAVMMINVMNKCCIRALKFSRHY